MQAVWLNAIDADDGEMREFHLPSSTKAPYTALFRQLTTVSSGIMIFSSGAMLSAKVLHQI